MELLNLKISRPYHNVCAMDSIEIKVHGTIVNLQVKLGAYLGITFPMDMLIIDVPDVWGMLLSRKWDATLGVHIQTDLSYATIPSYENSFVKLHREKERKFHVEDPKEPMNEFVYHMNDIENYAICSNFIELVKEKLKEEKVDEVWKMNFDGAHSRSGKGAGIVLTSPTKKSYNFAFILDFDATNNVAKYESLLLGLEITKYMGIKILNIKGDSDLVILQVKKYACKSEWLRI
jgi:hypothetical protein